LSFTRAATTVVGTLALCHPLGMKRGVEMISPLASTLAEDCRVQESLSSNFSERGLWAGWEAESAQRGCVPRNKSTENFVIKSRDRIHRFAIFIRLPLLIDFLPVSGTADVSRANSIREIRGITRLLIRFNSSFAGGPAVRQSSTGL